MDYLENLYDVEIFQHDGSCSVGYSITLKEALEWCGTYDNVDSIYIMTADPYSHIIKENESDEV